MEINRIKPREKILPILKKVLKPLGWKSRRKMPHGFIYMDEKWIFNINYRFRDFAQFCYVGNFLMLHKEVDEFFVKNNIEIPKKIFSWSDNGKYDLYTSKDKIPSRSFCPHNIPGNLERMEEYIGNYNRAVNSESDLEKWAKSEEEYLVGAGMDFIEEYKFLPNVLKDLDKEYKEREQWSRLNSGGLTKFSHLIVISKLCSDKNFDEKIHQCEEKMDGKYLQKVEKRWEYWHYFLKLVEKLEPIYPYYGDLSDDELKEMNPPIFKDKLKNIIN